MLFCNFAGIVLANIMIFSRLVSAKKVLFSLTVPANKVLFASTLQENNRFSLNLDLYELLNLFNTFRKLPNLLSEDPKLPAFFPELEGNPDNCYHFQNTNFN